MPKEDLLLSSLPLALETGYSAPYLLLSLTPKDRFGYVLMDKAIQHFFSPFYILESNARHLDQKPTDWTPCVNVHTPA
jgi:hypothetical protein